MKVPLFHIASFLTLSVDDFSSTINSICVFIVYESSLPIAKYDIIDQSPLIPFIGSIRSDKFVVVTTLGKVVLPSLSIVYLPVYGVIPESMLK